MIFYVNETPNGIVAPDKNLCKVKDCQRSRLKKKKRQHAFCKGHTGFRRQMSKKKFKEFVGNNELLVVE